MTNDEKWIQELKSKIINEDDKVLFNESSGCFLSGHLRASYILSWISIIESLKSKIRLFSNLGDRRATDAYKGIEKAEEQKLSTDKLIFEESKKCGIIDNADLSTINFLWEQRCLFAHPYNKQPELDEVKHIIGQSVKLVLGKELFYNKDFLTELSNNIANKPFFLPTELERVREFAKRTIARTPEQLHPFLFKTLLSKVGEIISNEEKIDELRKLHCYIIELFKSTQISLDNTNWSLENRVTNFPYESFIGFIDQETWIKLPKRIKEMFIAYFENEVDNSKLIKLKSIMWSLVHHNVIEADFKEKYFIKLNKIGFDSAINFYGDVNAKYKRIKTELESGQFDQQNHVIDHLKNDKLSKFLTALSSRDQFDLGRILKICASEGHWKTQNLLQNIFNGTIKIPDNIKAGIAYSSFISKKGEYSLDEKYVVDSVKLLNVISSDIQKQTYQEIFEIISKNKPDDIEKMVFDEEKITEKFRYIDDKIENWTESSKSNFGLLLEKIKIYYS